MLDLDKLEKKPIIMIEWLTDLFKEDLMVPTKK